MLHTAYLMRLLNPVFCMCLHCLLSLSSSTSYKLSELCLAYHWSNSCWRWATVNKVRHQSFYVLPSFLQPCLCPFLYPYWFFLNHSKSFMFSVLKCSFLHPVLALLILLWTNSASHVSWRFGSTLRQVPCDHRLKWWLFTRSCLHWLTSLDLTASPNDVSVMMDMGVTISMSPWSSSHSQRSGGRGCSSSLTRWVRFSRVRNCWIWLNFAPRLYQGALAANRSSLTMSDLTSLWLLLISSVQLLCQMSSAALVTATNVLRQSFAVRMFGPSSMRIQQACRHHNMRLLDTSFLWCWCLKMSSSSFLCSILCNAEHFTTSVLNSLSVYTRMFVSSTRILVISLTPTRGGVSSSRSHLSVLSDSWYPYCSVPQFPLLCGHFSFTTSAFIICASFPSSFHTCNSRSKSSACRCHAWFFSWCSSRSPGCGALVLSLGTRNIPHAFPFLLLGPTSSTLAATRCLSSPSVGSLSSLHRSGCRQSSCTIVPQGREPPAAMFGATLCCSPPHSFRSLTHSILIVLSSFSCHIQSSSDWFLFFWLSVFVFMAMSHVIQHLLLFSLFG